MYYWKGLTWIFLLKPKSLLVDMRERGLWKVLKFWVLLLSKKGFHCGISFARVVVQVVSPQFVLQEERWEGSSSCLMFSLGNGGLIELIKCDGRKKARSRPFSSKAVIVIVNWISLRLSSLQLQTYKDSFATAPPKLVMMEQSRNCTREKPELCSTKTTSSHTTMKYGLAW